MPFREPKRNCLAADQRECPPIARRGGSSYTTHSNHPHKSTKSQKCFVVIGSPASVAVVSPASLLLASVILSLSVAALVAYFRARENAVQRDSIRQRQELDDTICALGTARDAATNTQQNAESARRRDGKTNQQHVPGEQEKITDAGTHL